MSVPPTLGSPRRRATDSFVLEFVRFGLWGVTLLTILGIALLMWELVGDMHDLGLELRKDRLAASEVRSQLLQQRLDQEKLLRLICERTAVTEADRVGCK